MIGLDGITPGVALYIALVVAAAGWVQGALGMGFPLIATPLIAAVSGIQIAITVVVIPCIATVIISILRSPDFVEVLRRFWWISLAAIVGAWAGARLFVLYPEFPYTLLLAGLIIFYLNMNRLGHGVWPLMQQHEKAAGLLFGLLGGLSESTANIAAPPLIIYYLGIGLPPLSLVPAMNISFFVGKVTQLGTLAASGMATLELWMATLPLAVIATFTSLAGSRVRNRIDAASYRRWLQLLLLAMATLLLLQFTYRQWLGG